METERRLPARTALINLVLMNRTVHGHNDLIKQLRSYDARSHELMIQSFPHGIGLIEFLKVVAGRSDCEVHESLSYNDELRNSPTPFVVLEEVRQSLRLEDLSCAPEGSELESGITAAIKVAVASRWRWWRQDNELGIGYRENLTPDQMSAPLAAFIMGHQKSLDDIISYVTANDRKPKEIDIDHLREYLNHAAPAMREGLL